jgi:hypothetical protein
MTEDQFPPSGEEAEDFAWWERALAGLVGVALFGAGLYATLESVNDIASAALTVGGAIFTYIGVSGSAVGSWRMAGNEVKMTRRRRRMAERVQTRLAESTSEGEREEIAFEAQAYEDVLPHEIQLVTASLRSRSRLKRDVVEDIAEEAGVPVPQLGVGSTTPLSFFDALARRFGVTGAGGQEIAKQIVEAGGGQWGPECESRGGLVTLEGLERLLRAIKRLKTQE